MNPTRRTPELSLVILTWNAGPEFPEILQLIRSQELDRQLEIIVIDSGSTDGTLEFLKEQPVRLVQIPNSEFNHGLTRNQGLQAARGDLVAFAVQDARPYDRHWLQRLVDCFDDPEVAGAYSCQLPRPDANIFVKDRLSHWAAAQTEPRTQYIRSQEEFERLPPLEKLTTVAFDNVSSCVRRDVALEIPFRKRKFGEDIDWGHRVILAGLKIIFEPGSKVIHSHDNSIWYEFKRVYLDHQNLHRLFRVHTVPRWRDVFNCTKAAIGHLLEVVEKYELSRMRKLKWQARSLPVGFSQNLAQYLGARSASKLEQQNLGYRILDALLRKGV